MNRANAIILVLAGAAAPGAVATFGLADMARLVALVFVLALVCIVALRGSHEATGALHALPAPEDYETAPTAQLEYDELSVVTTRLGDLPSWVTEYREGE